MPDYVFFNHSIHIAKGRVPVVPRDVDKMNLTFQSKSLLMEWCIKCHRDPARTCGPGTKCSA